MEGWQRAFVLHGRPYSETSLMLDLFTEGHGRVRVLAKGARSRRSNLKGALQPFTPLLVRWGGRGEVKTLRNAEPVSLSLPLSGLMLYSGLYVNELLAHLGYGVDFLHCAGSGEPVADGMTYRYREEKGFIASLVIDNHSFTGLQLKALAEREFPDSDTLRAAKRFTRMALKPYLGGKPLKSRELFRQFNVKAPSEKPLDSTD